MVFSRITGPISIKLGKICLVWPQVFMNNQPFNSQKGDNDFLLSMLWNMAYVFIDDHEHFVTILQAFKYMHWSTYQYYPFSINPSHPLLSLIFAWIWNVSCCNKPYRTFDVLLGLLKRRMLNCFHFCPTRLSRWARYFEQKLLLVRQWRGRVPCEIFMMYDLPWCQWST